ncbi:uncharacterized protein LOC130712345 [Lotus japonicus]|uniref:uncharacterized protein LOC130712345 n=1 Tax=Lotus japonicus TaxID=34305 RepID=UPI0025867A51|nr:uncharacterized protein LOC130712345 [Lotus japonicus]
MRTDFNRHGPPRFEGEVEPEKADLCIQEMEKIFETLRTPDAEKVNLVAFMLKGDAEYWWRSAKQLMTDNNEAITWESFKRAFMDKYFPETAREEMENQFLRLRQGTMTVGEYAAKLEALSKHFRFSQVQVDEAYLCNRFLRGLKNEIEKVVRPLGIRVYKQVVEKAREVEAMENRQRGRPDNGGSVRSGQSQPERYSGHKSAGRFDRGHIERDCPNAAKGELVLNTARGRRPSAPGQVFAISGEQAAVTDDLIQVSIDLRGSEVNLVCLGLKELDVILGMDWLTQYHVLLDCANKVVVFPDSGVTDYLNSYTLGKSSPAFVNSIVAEAKNDNDVLNIMVVQDFVDVFPDDVPGLPPVRETEFSIDIMPGTGPISMAPYRMAPAELTELAKQLDDLSSKGFIRPSVSPWGAPLLLVKKKDGGPGCA